MLNYINIEAIFVFKIRKNHFLPKFFRELWEKRVNKYVNTNIIFNEIDGNGLS